MDNNLIGHDTFSPLIIYLCHNTVNYGNLSTPHFLTTNMRRVTQTNNQEGLLLSALTNGKINSGNKGKKNQAWGVGPVKVTETKEILNKC